MKIFYLIYLLLLLMVNISILGQSKYGNAQIIQSTIGQPKLTIQVLDYENDEPLIGAYIYLSSSDDIIATTDTDGKAILEKSILYSLRISYIGCESFCFKISDDTIDNIIVRLKYYIPHDWGLLVYSPETDSLKEAGRIDAENDIDDGNIQLIFHNEPTEEQIEFAHNYKFKFCNVKDKQIYYIISYNEIVLDFLSDKFDLNIRKELGAICWINY